ncbi:MAG TPA: alpha/beta hydrolase [Allosphingosinicella sp.]|nr:alpha/beta hydrolase [Allosphingosinicella sp.]
MQVLNEAGARASTPTLVERYGADDVRRGDLRVPPGRGPFPVVILIHGGCWRSDMGGQVNMAPLADALARRGFATWSFTYRRVGQPGAGWPGTFEDVAAGVDHGRSLGRRYRLDLSRIVIVGHSSGAHLALWAASRPRLRNPVAGRNPLRAAAVVAIDGPGALAPFIGIDARICGQPAVVPLMGGSPAERAAEYRLATPADHLPLGVRTLLVLAGLSRLMEPYAEAARAAGEDVVLLTPEGGDHFNILNPGTPQGSRVVEFIATTALPRPARGN